MASCTVLISGAGIAGCTLAYWMARNGWSVTVIERGASLRTSGSPVDVRGPAAHVAERMNIASQLRDARVRRDARPNPTASFHQDGCETSRV
jgi:2-polyprenyl-6-methoxyphenol hydroxylase-like FAD-dependent oxidoreductase